MGFGRVDGFEGEEPEGEGVLPLGKLTGPCADPDGSLGMGGVGSPGPAGPLNQVGAIGHGGVCSLGQGGLWGQVGSVGRVHARGHTQRSLWDRVARLWCDSPLRAGGVEDAANPTW
nr:hypothetical protein GCM10010200_045240 [Actinomadura rugatobispora]